MSQAWRYAKSKGEELGLPEVIDIPDEKRQDPIFVSGDGTTIGRDGCRVPLPSTNTPNSFGFTTGEPWLPMPRWFERYSEEQEERDSGSTLNLYRSALQLRQGLQDKTEAISWVQSGDDVLHVVRPGGRHALMNMGRTAVPRPPGAFLLASGLLDEDLVPMDTTVWVRAEPRGQ